MRTTKTALRVETIPQQVMPPQEQTEAMTLLSEREQIVAHKREELVAHEPDFYWDLSDKKEPHTNR